LAQLGEVAQEYDRSEYFITNAEKQFAGNALELMVAFYKAEQLPVRVRLYAAAKAVEYELTGGKTIEEIRPEIEAEKQEDPEEAYRETLEIVSRFARYAALEMASRMNGRAKHKSGCPAWIGDLVDELYDKVRAEAHATEIRPPPPPPIVVRKRQSVEIDGATDLSSGGNGVDIRGNPSSRDAERPAVSASCQQPERESTPAAASNLQEPPPSQWDNPRQMCSPPPQEMVPTLAGNGRIKYIPRPR